MPGCVLLLEHTCVCVGVMKARLQVGSLEFVDHTSSVLFCIPYKRRELRLLSNKNRKRNLESKIARTCCHELLEHAIVN